jgi:hypothetical protein
MKTAENSKNKQKQILSKLPPKLRLHWEDAYHLLRDRAHVSEEEAIDFANGKVRSIRSVQRQLVHS